jgi:Beta-propeller repeat
MIGLKFWLGKVAKSWRQLLVTGGTLVALGACGPGLDSLAPFSIGGTVSGLTGTLVLQNNGGDNLSLTGNGAFKFNTELASAAAYAVTVLTQPIGQFCTVSGSSGAATDDVTTVAVQCTWAGTKQFGASQGEALAYSVATDASGNVFVAGVTNGVLDNNLKVGNTDFFVTKYNSSGVKLATVQMGGVTGSAAAVYSVVTDATGSVYVAGSSSRTVGALITTDFFVARFDNSLLASPTKYQLGGTPGTSAEAKSITVDESSVYVAGYTNADLNTSNVTLPGNYAFVAKFDKSLVNAPTIVQLGVSGVDTQGNAIGTDIGGVYVTGWTEGALDGNAPRGARDVFVAKFDKNLVSQTAIVQLGLTGTETVGNSIATNVNGVYVAGSTNGILDVLGASGNTDFFITKFDNNLLNPLTVQLGGFSSPLTNGNGIAADADGNVYVSGTTGGLLGNTFTDVNGSGSGLFIAKYTSSLGRQFVQQLGSTTGTTTEGSSVAIDTSGNVYAAGYTDGLLDGSTRVLVNRESFVTKYLSGSFK